MNFRVTSSARSISKIWNLVLLISDIVCGQFLGWLPLSLMVCVQNCRANLILFRMAHSGTLNLHEDGDDITQQEVMGRSYDASFPTSASVYIMMLLGSIN
jgi:hypothetical protein